MIDMIQRVQTLYLALSLLSLLSACFFPLYHYKTGEAQISVSLSGAHDTSQTGIAASQKAAPRCWVRTARQLIPLSGVILGAALLLYNITLHTRRPRQIFVCNLAFLLIGGVLVFMFYDASEQGRQVAYQAGSYALLVALLFILLARIYIRRDERLVRSSERIR